jgi:hypothetical protein
LPAAPPLATDELAEIIEAWPTLPVAIQAGILAMVQTTSGRGQDRLGGLAESDRTSVSGGLPTGMP